MLKKELLGLSYEAFKSNFMSLSKPYKLNFAITMWCQSRCLTCNIWQLKPKNELTIEEIREFAKKNNSFRWIGLTGGEPFLRGDIVEIVKAFKENSKGLYLLTLPTNSLCSKDMVVGKIKQMLELGIPEIVITLSLDGNRETHDKVRGVPGNFDKVLAMYKALAELKSSHRNLSFVFGYTMSSINQGQFEKTYHDIRMEIPEVDYNDFHINIAQLSNNYYNNTGDNAILADRSSVIGELYEIMKKRKRTSSPMQLIEDRFTKGLIEFAETGKTPIRCRSLDASLFMDNFGNVYPSIMWDRKIANIRDIEYDLAKAWNGSEAEEARALISEGNDPIQWTSCEAYQSILGGLNPFSEAMRRAKRKGNPTHHEGEKRDEIIVSKVEN